MQRRKVTIVPVMLPLLMSHGVPRIAVLLLRTGVQKLHMPPQLRESFTQLRIRTHATHINIALFESNNLSDPSP